MASKQAEAATRRGKVRKCSARAAKRSDRLRSARHWSEYNAKMLWNFTLGALFGTLV
jgi:hypothetical protein